MAFIKSNIGAPGLLFPFVLHSIETGVMREAKDSEGGFPVFGRVGDAMGCFVTQSGSSDAVARVQKIDVTATSAVGSKAVSVTIGFKTVSITTTASDAAADVVGDLATAINSDSTGAGAIVTASTSSGTLILTFKTAGAAANAVLVGCASEDSAVTIAKATSGNTEGADAVTATSFKGFAQRTLRNDKFEVGDVVNVIKKGRFWVKVLGQVLAGEQAYINDTNNGVTATSAGATAIAGGTFKSNAGDGELAELEIA